MDNAPSTIAGLFGLVALVAGLFCARPRMAALIGAVAGLLYVAVMLAALAGHLNEIGARFAGRLVGSAVVIFLLAVGAHFVRRGVARLFRRGGTAPPL